MYLTSKREKATPSLKINELCFVHSLFLHEKKNSIDRYLMNIPHTRYLRPLFFFYETAYLLAFLAYVNLAATQECLYASYER